MKTTVLRDLVEDLRQGARSLRKSPGFTALVVLSLALGIGANATIFGLLNAVLLRPLDVRDPERLVMFSTGLMHGRMDSPFVEGRVNAYSWRAFERLRDGTDGLEGLAVQDSSDAQAIVRWQGPDRAVDTTARGRAVTANYFDLLGVKAHRGRILQADDQTSPGANPVVVLSHAYWQRVFGGTPAAIGATISLDGRPYTVVGVAAPSFTGFHVGPATDFWYPITMQGDLMPRLLDRPHVRWLLVIGRLRPDATLATAEASANAAFQQFLSAHPGLVKAGTSAAAVRIGLEPGARGASGLRGHFRDALVVLMVGVGLLFAIVCLNLGHLLLARAIHRQREMTIRVALGATTGRLTRRLLTEGLLLALLGAAAGALVTRWLTDGVLAVIMVGGLPRPALALDPDGRVLLFMGLLVAGSALLLGLVPAFQAARTDLQQALRATATAVTTGRSRRLASRLLLASQVAFSLVLLVGAGLLAGSTQRLRAVTKGFQPDGLLLAELRRERASKLAPGQELALHDRILARVSALPGVQAASMSFCGMLRCEGRVMVIGTEPPSAPIQLHRAIVTPGFFAATGSRLRRGRDFTSADHRQTPPVAVVNEALARRHFGSAEAALGQRLLNSPERQSTLEIVGVVEDVRFDGDREGPQPTFYIPVAQEPLFLWHLEVRGTVAPVLLAEAVRAVDPHLGIVNVRTGVELVDLLLTQDRILSVLSVAFAVAALFLVCVGLYGVIAQWAAHRTQELGVRMALGATAGAVRWLVLRQAFLLVLAGVAVGVPAAMAGGQLLKKLLYGVGPTDPLTMGLAALTMFVVAAAAAFVPARRASRIPPMRALRYE